jgi:acetyltransferase
LGDADAARYQQALNKLLSQKKVNNVLVLLTPQTSTEPDQTAQAIIAAAQKYPHKLIMTSFVGGAAVASARALFARHNVPTYNYPEEAVRSFKKLITYRTTVKNLQPYRAIDYPVKKQPASTDYLAGFALLQSYQIPVVPTVRYAASQLRAYKYPAVLKITGPDFLHKTDKGGVVANLASAANLRAAVHDLQVKNRRALLQPDNYLVVQPQAAHFQEIILGFKRDASFGPLLMIGQGGIYTEIFKDFKLAISDITLAQALTLLSGLKIYPILNGARGQKKYDIRALAQALVRLAKLANEHPEISELDINPLFVFEQGVAAGDVRIIL